MLNIKVNSHDAAVVSVDNDGVVLTPDTDYAVTVDESAEPAEPATPDAGEAGENAPATGEEAGAGEPAV